MPVQEREKNESSHNSALETQALELQLQIGAWAQVEDREQLVVDPLESMSLVESDKSTYVSSLLSGAEKEQLRQVLLHNMDVFAWTHSDMVSINPVHASHKLNVIPSARSVRQKIRRFYSYRYQVIQTEVDNLLEAGFIREIKYREWLANVVVVSKKRQKMESVRGLHKSQ